MPNLRYFLVHAADIDAAVTACGPRHREVTGHELSVTLNNDNSKALIKCQGASREWRAGRSWIDRAIAVYDRDNRYEIRNWFYSAEWQRPEIDAGI